MDRFALKGDAQWVWPDPTGTCVSTFKNPLTMTYPFVPKSNKSLVPGHYWGYELPDGRWGAGRVLGIGTPRRSRNSLFIGQTHDWVGEAPPTSADIESAPFVRPGAPSRCHIRNVSEFTEILGWASTDDLEYPEVWAQIRPIERDGTTYDGATGYIGFPLELTEPTATEERAAKRAELTKPSNLQANDQARTLAGSLHPLGTFDTDVVSAAGLYYRALSAAFSETELSQVDHAVYLTRRSRLGNTYLEVTPEQIAESSVRLDAMAPKP